MSEIGTLCRTYVSTAAPVLEWARRTPDAPAVDDGTTALSYGQLGTAITSAADTLRSFGLGGGSRIIAVGENSVPLVVLLLAASSIGAHVVLENARRVAPEIAGIAAHSLPSHLFFVYAGSADAVAHGKAFGALDHASAELGRFGVATHEVPASDAQSAIPAEIPADIAAIIYTTGTTGQPKGVMLSHAALSYIASMIRELRNMAPSDRVYGVLPVTHVMGHASVLLGTLHAGAALYLAARFVPAECVDILRQRRITALQGAPAMFSKIAEYCAAHGIESFDDVRFIGSGGAPIDPTVKHKAEALFGCTLQNGYGLTEGASLCWTRFDEPNDDDSVGRPLPGVEVMFRDPEGRPVAQGEVGELWARGPNLMRGYFRNREQTERVMDRDGWFNTQDLGRFGADGRVYIVGRTKDVIIRSGFKVYPLEVESALNAHPEVLHSAVIGKAVSGNEEVVAYVELVRNATVTAEQLHQYAAQLLSPYKRPARINVVASLPVAANGKVLKSRLS